MEIGLAYLSTLGWLPPIVMLQRPQAVVPPVSPPSWRLLTGSIFIPENSPLVRCTLTLPSSGSLSFFPCRKDSEQRVWAVNKFLPPPHPHATHTHTHSGCIWAKRAFRNHKHQSYHMIAFSCVTQLQKASLHTERKSNRKQREHMARARTERLSVSNNKGTWPLHTAEMWHMAHFCSPFATRQLWLSKSRMWQSFWCRCCYY